LAHTATRDLYRADNLILLVAITALGEIMTPSLKRSHVQDFCHRRSPAWVQNEHSLENVLDVLGPATLEAGIFTTADNFTQIVHGLGLEGRLEDAELVEQYSKRPYVDFAIVWAVSPHFRGKVVRSTHTGRSLALPEYGSHTQVSELGPRALEEDVCGLDVSMDDLVLVKALQGFANLKDDGPYSLFWEILTTLVVTLELLEEVTVTHKLCDDIKLV